MKKWDISVNIKNIPEDNFDEFLRDLESYIRKSGCSVTFGIGEESEDFGDE